MDLLVSIIVPVYNTEVKYFDLCIKSLIEQTYNNYEIIVINDGSTNLETIEYLRKIRKIEKISVFDGPNEGVSRAREKGIDLAKGNYIVFVDADDFSSIFLIERLLQIVKKAGAPLGVIKGKEIFDVNASFSEIYEKNTEKEIEMINDNNEIIGILTENCGYPIGWCMWGKIFDAQLLKNTYVSHPECIRAEDVVSLYDFLLDQDCIASAEDELYFYNKENVNSATNKVSKKRLTRAKAFVKIYEICLGRVSTENFCAIAKNMIDELIAAISCACKMNYSNEFWEYVDILKKHFSAIHYIKGTNRKKCLLIRFFPRIYRRLSKIRG